jgi:hypothetical protein
MAGASFRRRVAIEFRIWRAVLSGGAAGSATFGKARRFDDEDGRHARGGKRSPLADQEAVSGNREGGVMVQAAPAAALEVAKPDLPLELAIVPLMLESFSKRTRFRS